MYELIKVSDNTYYIQSPAKIGIVKVGDGEICLIDSGNDKDAAKRVLKLLNTEGWRLKAIYNTHSHADHIGGNKYLQEQTGCKIYAPEIECSFIKHPVFEPAFLYGGNPHSGLRHKFLMAKESRVTPITEGITEDGLEAIALPGHCYGMVGYRTPDNIVFLADALSSRETVDKYKIGFNYDIGAELETLEFLKSLSARLFIPSHAEPCEDISALADYNIQALTEIKNKLLSIISEPKSFDAILKELFDAYALTMTCEQHELVGSTVRSYLSWLCDMGEAEIMITDNIMLWKNKA